jgi:hypothetical protein
MEDTYTAITAVLHSCLALRCLTVRAIQPRMRDKCDKLEHVWQAEAMA